MAIFDILSGEFIDVIEWVDNTRDTMVWRYETRGRAIKYGAKLTVREGQAAVFIHEGQLADVFGPGLYMLETNNLPVLTRLQHWDHGFRSPFKSEIYFVNTTRFNNLKWGTRNPIIARDPEFGPVRLRAFGTYSMRVTDPGVFMREIVGTDGEFTADEIAFQLRNVIVEAFSRLIASSGIPVLDMAANTGQLGQMVARAIQPTVSQYGLSLPEFYIENVSLPDEVERMLDKRTSAGIVGDLGRFGQYAQAEAMLNASTQPGGAMGAAIGAGMGAAIGMGAAGGMVRGPWGPAPMPAPAPSPAYQPQPAHGMLAAATAGEAVWHVALDGAAAGPFGRAGYEGHPRWSGPPVRTAGLPRTRSTRWPSFSPCCPRRCRKPRRNPAPKAARAPSYVPKYPGGSAERAGGNAPLPLSQGAQARCPRPRPSIVIPARIAARALNSRPARTRSPALIAGIARTSAPASAAPPRASAAGRPTGPRCCCATPRPAVRCNGTAGINRPS